MTILQALAALDRLEPNDYSDATKLQWLSEFDGQVQKDVYDTHLCECRKPFQGYDCRTDLAATQLLIPAPYDGVYLAYLLLRICVQNADGARYPVVLNEFNRTYRSFTDWFNRTYRPKAGCALKF